jgi:glycosyltransferase involved in cell wall biosynthesis
VTRATLVGLIAGGQSGVPRYAAALTDALDRVAPEFPELALRLLTTPAGLERAAPASLEVELVRGRLQGATAGPRRIVAEQLAARRATGDLLHFFDLTGPLLAPRRRFVATVHDAAIRHAFQRLRVAHKQVLQPLAIRRARAIVAVSAFARDEAVRHFGAEPGRIEVIHSGPGLIGTGVVAAGSLAGPSSSALSRPSGDYVLYVGNLAAHKNLTFLIRAFGRAATSARLVLVGSWGDRVTEVQDAIAASPASDRIELRSGVGDAELDALYAGARALLLPSLYEGFGFTALEAMSRGCPVVASDIPALREVCGPGAWLRPPDDEAAWSGAIEQLVADDAARDELRRRGAAQVATFSWERTAREVCALLLRAGADG